jgi:hypothetical protein
MFCGKVKYVISSGLSAVVVTKAEVPMNRDVVEKSVLTDPSVALGVTSSDFSTSFARYIELHCGRNDSFLQSTLNIGNKTGEFI